MVELFLEFLQACFNFNLIIVCTSYCKRKKNCSVLEEIIIACNHTSTWWVACNFSHSIASEFRDKARKCCMPLFFTCQSLPLSRNQVRLQNVTRSLFTTKKNKYGLIKKIRVVSDIGQTGYFLKKKHQKFHHPYSILF